MGNGDLPGEAGPSKAAVTERLRIIRREQFGTDSGRERLANLLGVPTQTWLNYESGVTIPGDVILKFIEATTVEPLWLLRGRGRKYRGRRRVDPRGGNTELRRN